MNTRNPLLISGVLAALAMPSLASAAAASHQCSQLWDDALRLGCYDTAFGKPVPPAASAPVAPVAPSAAPAAVVPAAAAPPAAATAAAPVVAAAVAPAAAVVAPAAASAPVPAPAPEKAKQPDSLATTVTSLSYALDGRFRATLENGQVWQQLELYPRVQVQVGDRVTLRKASLGSYQLLVPSGLTAKVALLK